MQEVHERPTSEVDHGGGDSQGCNLRGAKHGGLEQAARNIYSYCEACGAFLYSNGELTKRCDHISIDKEALRVYAVVASDGTSVLVDLKDKHLAQAATWAPTKDGHYRGTVGDRKEYLHLLIAKAMGLNAPMVDHRNRHKWDNRRCNLRAATAQQNRWNQGAYTGKHAGVDLYRGKWRARVQGGGKTRFLGYFNTEEEAAEAVKREMERVYGEFAARD